MNKEEYYSRLKKTTSKLLTDRCSYEESHNIALQQIYLKDKYIETLEKENQQLKHNRDKAIEFLEKSKLNQLDTHCKYLYIDFDNEKIENIDELIDILKGDSDYE